MCVCVAVAMCQWLNGSGSVWQCGSVVVCGSGTVPVQRRPVVVVHGVGIGACGQQGGGALGVPGVAVAAWQWQGGSGSVAAWQWQFEV
jgi:hypothetical protein